MRLKIYKKIMRNTLLKRLQQNATCFRLIFNLQILKMLTLTCSCEFIIIDLVNNFHWCFFLFNLTNPVHRAHQRHPPQVFGHFVETPAIVHLFPVFFFTQLHVLSLVPTENLPIVSLHPQ